ncbi:MAG: Gfo/Idh/MocA family oxidoreductase [Anaerolineaceae bacterium]|nr:Gfo/Idh/MocA family oxidoreductase [Anaerolineaceae bacterium]
MIRFGAVGTGWRTTFFLRVANARPDLFECVGVVTRDVEKAKDWVKPYDVPLFGSLDAMLAQKPLFVITSVPWDVNPGLITELAEKNFPVLSETPPARSIAEMEALYKLVQNGAKIAVAEQYHLQPHHAARIDLANSGKLGTVTQAQVSVAHGYHGISLIRRLLGIGYEDATISALQFTSPIVAGLERHGLPDEETTRDSVQTIATLNFGDKLGVFDFTNDQYRSYIRKQRILVRGDRGELINDTVRYLKDHRTPIELTFLRLNAGESGNLEGYHFKGIQLGSEWVYENPFAPAAINDEDIAIGQCMAKMAEYVGGADAFYPLAEACQDRYLDIKIAESLETGGPVHTSRQVWAQ